MSFRSKSGYNITKGDNVAYPVRAGSNMWLVIAEVLEVSDEGKVKLLPIQQDRGGDWSPAGRPRHTTCLDRMVHVKLHQP